jgi:hypothetical protein
MRACSVRGCERPHSARGFCGLHYARVARHNDPNAARKLGWVNCEGRAIFTVSAPGEPQRQRQLSYILAERAYGRPLPKGIVVHHLDGNPTNNARNNLVICNDRGYHSLLHARLRAYMATGNPNSRRCIFCKTYDSTAFMKLRATTNDYYHRECMNEDSRKRYAQNGKRRPQCRR